MAASKIRSMKRNAMRRFVMDAPLFRLVDTRLREETGMGRLGGGEAGGIDGGL
jgi:hypothetical protein